MDLELLRSFVTVAETGGFGAAARILNRTQSAVSLQIKRLEERLDARLFERSSRRVVLSETGSSLLPYARRMLRLQEEAKETVRHIGQKAILRLGIPDEQAMAYLDHLLGPFALAHPDVQLAIHCEASNRLIERLGDGLLDLVLAIRHSVSVGGDYVASQPLVWVAAEDFAIDPAAPLPLALHGIGCSYRAEGLAQLTRIDRSWQVSFTSQSPTGINVAVRAGLGITIKAARSVPGGCRVLGEDDGLPALQPATIELHRNPATGSLAAEDLARDLIMAVRRYKGPPS